MNNRTVVFLLKCVFLYGENPTSCETARSILLAYATKGPDCDELKRARDGDHGGFMKAVCNGDFFGAYQVAIDSNKDALAMGMRRYLRMPMTGQSSLYNDGIEPSDYLPQPVDVKE